MVESTAAANKDHFDLIRLDPATWKFKIGPRFYVSKQFFRYLRPGAYKVGCISSDTNSVWALAYKHDTQQTVTVLLLNRSNTTQTVTLSGNDLPQSLDIFQSSPTQNCVNMGTIAAGGMVSLPPTSITTLYNKPMPTAVINPKRISGNAINRAAKVHAQYFDLCGRRLSGSNVHNAATGLQIYIIKHQDGSVAKSLTNNLIF